MNSPFAHIARKRAVAAAGHTPPHGHNAHRSRDRTPSRPLTAQDQAELTRRESGPAPLRREHHKTPEEQAQARARQQAEAQSRAAQARHGIGRAPAPVQHTGMPPRMLPSEAEQLAIQEAEERLRGELAGPSA